MKCFVTGATGFVGGHLCAKLVAEGHEVVALIRPDAKRDALKKLGARIAQGTIESTNVFAHYAEQTDVFFHLAAVTKPVREASFDSVNRVGTEHVLAGLVRGDFHGKFVLLSSLAAGGPAAAIDSPRRETDPDAPVSRYGESKLAAETAVRNALPKGCPWTILRPGAIYGPREHQILEVLRMMHRHKVAVQFGDGVAVQMTHVDDVVEALLQAAFNPQSSGRTYYINDRAVWGFEDVVKMASEALGHPVRLIKLPMAAGGALAAVLDGLGAVLGKSLAPLGRDKFREMEARFWVADPTLAERELRWQPKWEFSRGLASTIEWYQQNQAL